jgi:hypothetical protein
MRVIRASIVSSGSVMSINPAAILQLKPATVCFEREHLEIPAVSVKPMGLSTRYQYERGREAGGQLPERGF